MGKKMSNAPVYFTVAQVRFNPILNLDSYLSTIQPQMRDIGFPDYKQEILQRLVLPSGGADGGQFTSPSLAPHPRFIFGSMDSQSSFVLESNSFAFQTTAYDTFETFSSTLLNGLSILNKTLRLDFTERIGLRYLDAIQPNPASESLADYLIPEVLGLSQKLGGQLGHSVGETISISSVCQLVSRIIIQNGKVGLPPDLLAVAPKLNPRFTQSEGLHAILDNDAYSEQRVSFDLSSLEKSLLALHEEIRKSFEMTVSAHALKVWG